MFYGYAGLAAYGFPGWGSDGRLWRGLVALRNESREGSEVSIGSVGGSCLVWVDVWCARADVSVLALAGLFCS